MVRLKGAGQLGDYVDEYTRKNIMQGQFTGVGNVHFSNEINLNYLFKDFSILHLEEKLVRRSIPNDAHTFASFNIVAIKNVN